MVAVLFVSASTTCKECPDDNGPRAWPRNSDGSITDDARCCGATRDSNGSTDAIVDALDSTSDREEKLVPVARLLPDAGDTITGSIAHMRRRLKSPRRPDRPKWSRANPGQGTMSPRKPDVAQDGTAMPAGCASLSRGGTTARLSQFLVQLRLFWMVTRVGLD